METIAVKAYHYSELSDEAKEKAREWYRDGNTFDNGEQVTEEFHDVIAPLLGWTIPEDGVSYSGFWSQGDGASFVGAWDAKDVDVRKLSAYAPQDEKLIAIGRAFATFAKANTGATARSVRDRAVHYSHAYSVDVELFDSEGDTDEEKQESFADMARDLMKWLYRALEEDYDFRNSDEQIAEEIEANDYLFTENGRRSVTL